MHGASVPGPVWWHVLRPCGVLSVRVSIQLTRLAAKLAPVLTTLIPPLLSAVITVSLDATCLPGTQVPRASYHLNHTPRIYMQRLKECNCLIDLIVSPRRVSPVTHHCYLAYNHDTGRPQKRHVHTSASRFTQSCP